MVCAKCAATTLQKKVDPGPRNKKKKEPAKRKNEVRGDDESGQEPRRKTPTILGPEIPLVIVVVIVVKVIEIVKVMRGKRSPRNLLGPGLQRPLLRGEERQRCSEREK